MNRHRLYATALAALAAFLMEGPPCEAQLADNNRGFPPNTSFATSGIDHVNLFSTNVVESLPIGPDYPIGVGFTQQLRLTYNSQIWTPRLACYDPDTWSEVLGVYVTGSPLIGAGWNLEFGHLSGLSYTSPDGSVHLLTQTGSVYLTEDGSYIRGRNFEAASATLDFPNGDIGTFSQVISHSTRQHGTAAIHDFNTGSLDPDQSTGSELHLTRLQNRFGDWFDVNYATIGGVTRIATVKHYGQGILQRTITFNYNSNLVVTAGSTTNTWTVLSSIDFPTVGGATQSVVFNYYTGGFQRTVSDVTGVPGYCLVTEASKPVVAAPLLQSVQLQPGYSYTFDYFRLLSQGWGSNAGVIAQITVPTGGVIKYQWFGLDNPGNAPTQVATGFESCDPFDFVCHQRFIRTNVPRLSARKEYPSGTGTPNTWTYSSVTFENPTDGYAYDVTQVVAPDGYVTKHYFHREPNGTAANQSNGMPLKVELYDSLGNLVRKVLSYYDDDNEHVGFSGPGAEFRLLTGNIRESQTETTAVGAPSRTKSVSRTQWDNFGHWGQERFYEWGSPLSPSRTVTTVWTPNSTDWVLNLYSQRTETDGLTTRDEYFYFDNATGFLRGTAMWDPAPPADPPPPPWKTSQTDRIHATCIYGNPNETPDGRVLQEVTATATHDRPTSNPCFGYALPPPQTPKRFGDFSLWPLGVMGLNNDNFGKWNTYNAQGLVTATHWIKSNGSTNVYEPSAVASARVSRDATTGLVTTSFDVSGVATQTAYDLLRRPTQITPDGEVSTYVCYANPTTVVVYRATSSLTCPLGSGTTLTFLEYIYDGFGRLTREIRKQPTGSSSAYALRLRLYDSVGRENWTSEWVGCGTVAGCSTQPIADTSATRSSNFDPFGRPQTISHPGASNATISYADAGVDFSDTKKKVTLTDINGTPQPGGGWTGGITADTTYRYDVFGRLTSVTETDGVATSYGYDVNGKLTRVAQPTLPDRNFDYDPFGFLRHEFTPEKGEVRYDNYGSLGNLIQDSQPPQPPALSPGPVISRTYDFAGRLTGIATGGVTYLKNCYDGVACSDDNPTGGGNKALGKLTHRIGSNYLLGTTLGPRVIEDYVYTSPTGRPASRRVRVGSGGDNLDVNESWTYNNLGLESTHNQLRPTGSAFQVTTNYDNGLPTLVIAAGQTVVSQIKYQPSGALAAYTTGNNKTTTITQDGALSRPLTISSPGGFESGTYKYDGVGNIRFIGTDAFTYDSRSRLISANFGSSGSRDFNYDALGNLTQNGASSFAILLGTNRLQNAGYDGRGNLISFGSESLGYDALDRQISAISPSAWWNYVYDGAGERQLKLPGANPVLRREMAKYLIQARGESPATGCTTLSFTDVSCGDLDWGWIEKAKLDGITSGCTPTKFCPADSVTRTTAAKFIVTARGEQAYAGPCDNNNLTFQDVNCQHPFWGWIEQIFRDGITSGCVPTPPRSFCPDAISTELQVMTLLARAWPNGPGKPFQAVPRGSTHTLRDPQNRIATEFAGAAVGRDNIYLGNLLVGSYVSSPLSGLVGWQYYASDHLGTPRQGTGTATENYRYWPYGEPVTPSTSSQRVRFASMERDNESNRYPDHARHYEFNLARFLSPDLISGKPEDPQTWNRYAYARNNPNTYVDTDGKEFGYPGQQDDLNRVLLSQLTPGSEICMACDAGQWLGRAVPLRPPSFPPEEIIAAGISGIIKGFAARPAAELALEFTQDSVRSTFRNGPFAGQELMSVADGLKAGAIKAETLTIDIIKRNGVNYTLNNRSLTALRIAGVKPVIRDVTGMARFERILTNRLRELARKRKLPLRQQLPEIR